jgi:hypothetical protein
MRTNQKDYESKRAEKAGLSLLDWMLRKVPYDPMPDLIDRVIDLCNRSDAKLDADRQPNGDVLGDLQTFKLLQEKDQALQQLRTSLKRAR